MKREERLREELEEAWFALVVEKIAQQEGAELNALNEQLKNDKQLLLDFAKNNITTEENQNGEIQQSKS